MPTEKLGIEIDSIAKDVANLKSMVQDLKDIQTAAGGAQTKMSDFQKQAEQTRSLRETFQSMNQVGLEMMAVSGGILYGFKKVGMGFINAALETEKYELTLRTLFRSAQKAKEEMAWAGEFEEITPYSLKDIIASDVVMRSFGLDARKYLGMAGDMAAVYGGDAATLQSVVMGVSKAMASGAAGMDILTRSFGITGDALRQFGWKGTKDLVGFRKALEHLLVTRYAGGMKDLQKTLPAIIEGFHSEWFKFRKMVGEPLVAKILPDFTKLYDELVKLRKTGQLDRWAKTVRDLFLGIYDAIKSATTEAWKLLKPILEFLKIHPEFAKLAGKILFIGSAFGLGIGAALHFTSQLGLAVLGVKALIGSLGGLAVAKAGIDATTLSVVGLQASLFGLPALIEIGIIITATYIGFKAGQKFMEEIQKGHLRIPVGFYLPDLNFYWGQAKKDLQEAKRLREQGITPLEPRKEPIEAIQERIQDLQKLRALVPPEVLADTNQLKSLITTELGAQWLLSAKKLNLPGIVPETFGKFIIEIDKTLDKEAQKLKILTANQSKYGLIGIQPSLTPTPADLGITPITDITATTRPEIDNYYYTIHFERDSVQINTLDLTPEKFAKALIEFGKRRSLVPQ
jgi:hypothetical protein